jgi:hypothetical protein
MNDNDQLMPELHRVLRSVAAQLMNGRRLWSSRRGQGGSQDGVSGFLALWKDADVPLLREAKAEYEKVK